MGKQEGSSVMSYRHYAGGEPQRVQRHQQYDPFAESDRYGSGGGQGRRDSGYAREEPPRSSGNGYGNYGSSAPVSRQSQGYSSGRSAQTGSYPASHAYGSMADPLPRAKESGFPSGIQESDVWRTNTSTNLQQRPSRQAVSYTHGSGREVYGQSWGGDQNTRNQHPTYSYKGAAGVQLGMSTPATQPVLMMVPQGSTSGLMGLVANPFSVPRQAGMQMITIPTGLNPNVFDQQHLMGGGTHRQQFGDPQPRSGRHSDRGLPSGGGGRESRVSSSSRGHGTHQSSAIRRRSSPGRGSCGVPRNAVYRKPININPSPSVPRKRVSDRADFGDRKKIRSEFIADRATGTGTANANSSPTKRATGNQKRKDKRKRDAEAKVAATAAAAASGSKGKGSPGKKAEQKEEKKETETKVTPAAGVEEKNETVEVIPVDAAEKKAEADVVVLDEGGEVVPASGKVEEEKKRKSKYDDFPTALLVCKVCQKSMNDGASFESHLSGRAHTALVKIVEERFEKRSELLMIESRLTEEEIGIELERQRRAGKSGGNSSKNNNHCKMCDCNYMVNWGTHKISLGHRILKEFLHPSCRYCDANFVHRMDWLNHLFGLTHLRRVSEQRNAGKDTSFHESPTQEELFTINLEMNQEEKPANFLTIRNLDWKIPTPTHIKDLLQEETEIQVPEGEIIIPNEHDGTVVIGKDVVISTTGYCCKVCRTYMTQEKEVDPHCMGKSHFGMYVSYLKKLIKMQEDQKAAEEKAAAEAAKKQAEAEKKAEVTTVDEVKDESEEVKGEEDGEANMDESGIAEDEGMELEGEAEEPLVGDEENDAPLMETSLNESILLNDSGDEEEAAVVTAEADKVDEKEAAVTAEAEKVDEKEAAVTAEAEKVDEEVTGAVAAEVETIPKEKEVQEDKKEVKEEGTPEEVVKVTEPVEEKVPAEVKIEPASPVTGKGAPAKPPMTPAAKAQAATAAARGAVGRCRGTPTRGRGAPSRGVVAATPAPRGGPARGTATRGGGPRGGRGSPRRPVAFRGRGR